MLEIVSRTVDQDVNLEAVYDALASMLLLTIGASK